MEQITVSISKAAELTSLHRATLYRAMESGKLRSFKVGSRRLIDVQSLREFVGVAEA
ncbi:helix-turn-helix domain-containing protein [Novosphingobium marinum]|uniref:Excisionase family DNA binding protein n=1 Tax=Novosphingobium marinum TaxID=1514948 RepID=A0A7Y9XTY4_9SPHN|nr:helix-turn-helix domain-containing protein [Novosphingobium marinum]NYH94541.1 excisionase family DNA binding protein [Novosphingobium marinum]